MDPVKIVKESLTKTYDMTYQNVCEKATFSMENELGQSDLPVLRQILKTTKNFLKTLKSAF